MATLAAIADNPNLADAIQRANASTRRAAEANRNADLSAALELPSLRRNGDSRTTALRVSDPLSGPTDFVVRFEELSAGVVGVEITRVALGTGSSVSFNIHLGPNGKVRGFDTDGSGQIDSIQPPNLGFIGPGAIIQFAFDDTALGPLDFGQFSFTTEFLDVLQGQGAAPGPTSTGIIQGTSGDDVITGTSAADTINGLAGNDTISGLSGNDIIDGGDGNDVLTGGAGADALTGGAGTDTVDYSSDAAAVTVDLANQTATDATGATDTLSGIENVTGSGFNDTITGDTGVNTLTGGAGNDTIDGGDGNDVLIGGAGTDALTGGAGTDTVDYSSDAAGVTVDLANQTATDGGGATDTLSGIENATGSAFDDTITGSTGDNSLTGGLGNDTFVISDGAGSDVILDFTAGVNTDDVIDLAGVAALNNFNAVKSATTDDIDGNAVIDLGGGATLTLMGVSVNDLHNADFSF